MTAFVVDLSMRAHETFYPFLALKVGKKGQNQLKAVFITLSIMGRWLSVGEGMFPKQHIALSCFPLQHEGLPKENIFISIHQGTIVYILPSVTL